MTFESRRPRRACLDGLPTATSRAQCPFCRGRRWVPWWVADRSTEEGLLMTSSLVDYPRDKMRQRGMSADECVRCGAVVSGPVEMPRSVKS